jgi:hypothetical protein
MRIDIREKVTLVNVLKDEITIACQSVTGE